MRDVSVLLQQRREARYRTKGIIIYDRTESIAESQPLKILSVDDPFVVSKVIIICVGSVW